LIEIHNGALSVGRDGLTEQALKTIMSSNKTILLMIASMPLKINSLLKNGFSEGGWFYDK